MTRLNRDSPTMYIRAVPQGRTTAERIDVSSQVLSMAYEDLEAGADKLTLNVDNFNLDHFDNPVFRKGGTLEVSWGYLGNMTPTRSVVIQDVTGFQVLQVVGLAKSILMHKTQRVRKFSNMTRAQVVRQVALENGYGVDVHHIDETHVVFEAIQQARETDAEFLKRLAGREGWEFFVDFDGLHFHERKLGQRPIREYTYYIDQTQGDIKSIKIENDVTAKPASITVVGRDPLTKTTFTETANNASTPRTGLGDILEIVDPKTGKTHLQEGTGTDTIAPSSETNAAAAARQAQGAFKKAQLTAVKMTMVTIGDPGQVAKSIVGMNGIRSLSGKYYVTSVKHTLDQSGAYDMELKMRRDGRSSSTASAAAKSSASQNNKSAPTETGDLVPKDVVDPVTGKVKTIYTETGGREGK